jgi:hypothetical protein
MRSKEHSTTAEIQIMGQAARGWLASGRCGKVLAVVSGAAYLLTEAGELVWLGTPKVPMHRRGMQVSVPLPRLAVDAAFKVEGQTLEFESGTNLDFHTARIWESPHPPAGDLPEQEQLPGKLLSVYNALIVRKTPVGFGNMIQPVLRIAKNEVSPSGMKQETMQIKSAWPVVERIARSCLAHDFPDVIKHAEALIGLGEGLTPSGDDFLGSVFLARYLLACSYPQLVYLNVDNLPGRIDALRPRTNPISFSLLMDNVLGHAPEPLSRFGCALLTNGSIDFALSAASELTALGHSTGWDLLTGFLTGMLFVFGNYRVPR